MVNPVCLGFLILMVVLMMLMLVLLLLLSFLRESQMEMSTLLMMGCKVNLGDYNH